MEKLDSHGTFRRLAAAIQKPCMYISFPNDDIEEVTKAAPYLSFPKDLRILQEGWAILVFDTDEERDDAYNRTVGDDGPTKLNAYDGPCRVYALTCDAKGGLLSENT